jgi:hypothetical protein
MNDDDLNGTKHDPLRPTMAEQTNFLPTGLYTPPNWGVEVDYIGHQRVQKN